MANGAFLFTKGLSLYAALLGGFFGPNLLAFANRIVTLYIFKKKKLYGHQDDEIKPEFLVLRLLAPTGSVLNSWCIEMAIKATMQ